MSKIHKQTILPRRKGLLRLSFNEAFPMIRNYAINKIKPQFKAVLMVSLFLAVVQYFLLGVAIVNALVIAVCVGAAILGLSFFLEGLFLAIMPLGEQCGARLPARIGAAGLTVFAVVIGITATLAEPAVGVLKQQGSVIPAWNAPLLYLLLNRGASWLVAAIAVGVGLSVVLGVYRFMFGWPFKPPVFIIIPVIVIASFICDENPILRPVVNLAWDTGGAATGAVTVPIILALGLGVAKTGGKNSGNSGLGLVTLASALPVASVLVLALFLAPKVPAASGAAEFFSAESSQRAKAEYIAGGSTELALLAEAAVRSGDLERTVFDENFSAGFEGTAEEEQVLPLFSPQSLRGNLSSALLAVLPLALVLVVSIVIVARDRILNADIVVLGVVFAAIGMFALNIGMSGGITAISSQAGSSLKYTYRQLFRTERSVIANNITENSFLTVSGENGPETFIWIPGENGPELVAFVPEQLTGNRYVHIPTENSVFSRYGIVGSYLMILVIVFFLGFLAIFAEPNLAVTAATVEEMTTGTFKRSKLIANAAIGVGLGMALGFARVLFSNLLPSGGIHLSWILAPCYGIALLLTIFAPEDFSSIAWDVAGIATGPIAVPIIITTGLGLGQDSLRADGAFGIVATASAFPIIVILVSGIIDKAKSRRSINAPASRVE